MNDRNLEVLRIGGRILLGLGASAADRLRRIIHHTFTPSRARMRWWSVVTALTFLYFVTGKIGLSLATVHVSATELWPPSGISLAALLILGRSCWPGVFLGAFLVNVTTAGTVLSSLGIATGNTLEAVAGAWLAQRLCGPDISFSTARQVLLFFAGPVLLSPMLSATIGVCVLSLSGLASWGDFPRIWMSWWIGDATGDLIVAPLIMVWRRLPSYSWTPARKVEAAAAVTLSVVAGLVVFHDGFPFPTGALPVSFLTMPIVVWAAYRFTQHGATLTAAIITVVGVAGTLHGFSLHTLGSTYNVLILYAVFMATLSMTGLILASVVSRQRELERSQSLLAKAGLLLGGGLSQESVVSNIARIALPDLADWCVVQIAQEDGSLRPFCIIHPDETQRRRVEEIIKRFPPPADASYGSALVYRTGRPQFISRIPKGWLREIALSPEHLQMLKALKLRSYLCVALFARERVVGTLSLAMAESGRRFQESDLGTAESLGRRIAMAVENADLLREKQEAIMARDEFFSIASHELNTPLTSLLLELDILYRRIQEGTAMPDSREAAEQIDECRKHARRLSRQIRQLVQVTQLRGGKVKLQPEPLDLSEVVRATIRPFQAELKFKQIHLQLDLAHGATGMWDRQRLEEILANLISNAIKYGEGRPVRLRVDVLSADVVRLRIRDQGIGVAPEMQGRLFDPFERAAPSRHYGGLGLGLYITRRNVELHGGRITMMSAQGQGTTFEIELPRHPPAASESGTHTGTTVPFVTGAPSSV